MGATNHTTYYELSQFIGTDKPAWLQDYNGDMAKIDTGINAAKVAADDAATAASGAQGDATDALTAIGNINGALETIETTLGTATGNINTINSLIGNGSPTTSDQTIIGAINGLEGAIAPREDGAALANSYAIGEQFARGGSVYTALTALTADTPFASLVLNTDYKVSDNLVEQITDVKESIPSFSGDYVVTSLMTTLATVTADGVKTTTELIHDLAEAFITNVDGYADGVYGVPRRLDIGGRGEFAIQKVSVHNNTTGHYGSTAAGSFAGATYVQTDAIAISDSSNGSAFKRVRIASDGTITYTDIGETVPAIDTELTIIGDIYTRL